MEKKVKEVLKGAIVNFFDLEQIREKAIIEAAENYIYQNDMDISSKIMEKMEIGLEETFDDLIDEVIESLLWD